MSMDQTTPSQPALASRRLKIAALVARLALGLVLAFWVLFGAAWAVLHGWIVPRIGEFRPRLETAASQVLGVPVRIGQITARPGGLIPSFELRDVALLDAQGREALRLPRVLAAVSPSSLWGLGFEQLYIDRPELDIRRTSDGKIYVAGLDVSPDPNDDSSAIADWVFSQTEFVIRGGTVRWTDDLRQVPLLALTQVDWTLRNPGRRHLMRLDATPPPEWGERFSLRGVFREPLWSGGAGQWRRWAGQMYAEFGRVDVSEVKRYANLASLGIDLRAGSGALRVWADVSDGQITGGTADVALLAVDAQLGKALQPLALQAVSGRFGGRQFANGFEFATEGLQFRTRDGLQWPGGNVSLVYTGAEGKAAARGEFRADKLDLAALALIASRLPLGDATHAMLTSLKPKGLVDVVEARWQGALDAPLAYAAKGRVSQLEVAPQAAAQGAGDRPGVRGAAVDFDLTQQGGQAKVRITNGDLHLPGIFEDPRLPFDQLSADAQWKLTGPNIELQLRNLVFANADAQGSAQASWHTADAPAAAAGGAAHDGRFPGVLDLQGSLSRGDGGRVHRYLPLILPDTVRHYVRDAVTQGALSDVKFRLKGNLNDMPFADPKLGEFRVSAKVAKATLAYVPRSIQPRDAGAWPALSELDGELVFDRASMQINGATGRIAGFPGLQVVKADARIPNLMHGATVQVVGEIKGPLAEAVAVVNTSPLGDITGQALATTVATGTAGYKLELSLPLDDLDKSRVKGSVSLAGNDVQFTPDTPQLTRAKALVSFTESGFAISGGQARLLGGDVRLDGGTRTAQAGAARPAEFPDATVLIRAQGTLSAEGLRQARGLDLVSRLGSRASGSTAYTASLGFRRGATEISVSSNLQGMALSLPAPLNKSAETALPLRFDNTVLRSATAGQALQDQLSLTVGRLALVQYVRDISGPEPRVLRGSIAIGLEPGESAPVPEAGVAANINLASVDIDAWEQVLAASPAPVAAAPAERLTPASAVLGYLPTTMAIRARELVFDGRKLNNVVLGGSRDGLTWRANIDATELNGYVEFRQPGGAGVGRLYARLSRLSLGQSTASEVEAILNEQPANVPALDIVVEDLELRGKKLGRVEIEAINRDAGTVAREGGVREWRLNKLNVIVPEATLTATGNWMAVNAQQAVAAGGSRGAVERRRTVMNFRLDIADSGELLKRFGMSDVIRRGKGKLEGQIAWVGSPLSLDYPSLSGQFNVNVASGQFLKAEPGIAKLLGVLSLQALPRRLTLDFRDVFSEGFSFDFVRGDVTINQGLAFTNNLQMKGVNAAVLMEGKADIARETQDLTVVVVPEINAGTASLIATVINPAIGLGSFLAQYFLRRPLTEAATQEFHIDGTWTNPKITKVDRKAAAEVKPGEKPDEDTGARK
ncbi:MAG: YhdP family protein [Polaromonas sp.]|uniref:YhdP family protein n=1 Tax=Polaromonas sp. TaxID=1869339 RepID=UPI00272FF096|nr:YhdP family protein [Polaromonas sp.]MDP2451241.1 YhdP family protein [Polaromonas sp.]MDP3246370.1 YhdP family protein [Polaromonas sp.]